MKTIVKTSKLPELYVTGTFDLDNIQHIRFVIADGSNHIVNVESKDLEYRCTRKLHDVCEYVSIQLSAIQSLVISIPQAEFNADDLDGINNKLCSDPSIARVRSMFKFPWSKINTRQMQAIPSTECAVITSYSKFHLDFKLCQESAETLKEWFYENWLELYNPLFVEIGKLYRDSMECENVLHNATSSLESLGCSYILAKSAESRLKALTTGMYIPEFMKIGATVVVQMDDLELLEFTKAPKPE